MTKRTNQTKTTIYRRHAGKCPINGQPNNVTQCECPLWLHGKIRGKFLRVSLDTRTLSTAEMRQRDLESGIDPTPDGSSGPQLIKTSVAGKETLEYAAAEFVKTNANLSSSTQTLYLRAVTHFCEWAAAQGVIMLREVESSHIRQYLAAHSTWKRSTAHTRLVHLRVFFNYCHRTRRWLQFPPTQDRTLVSKKKKGGSTRQPFSPAQITQVLAAVERMPADVRDRARALVYLLLYTGMRISDATFCERDYLTADNNMDYYVIKTRRPISLPPELHARAIEALAKLPASRVYFFQADREDDYRDARAALRDGEGEFSLLMPNYDARVRETTALILRVLTLAGIDGACHKFSDTFALNLLVGDGEKGTDIYTVSKMLGHSDVRITDEHYMKLVPGYRERMSKSTRVLAYQFPAAS